MAKPVSLTVHRNTRARRAAKTLQNDLTADIKSLRLMPGLAGYAIIGWNGDLGHLCHWSMPGPAMTANILPEYAAGALRRSIAISDSCEDDE